MSAVWGLALVLVLVLALMREMARPMHLVSGSEMGMGRERSGRRCPARVVELRPGRGQVHDAALSIRPLGFVSHAAVIQRNCQQGHMAYARQLTVNVDVDVIVTVDERTRADASLMGSRVVAGVHTAKRVRQAREGLCFSLCLV